MKWHDGCPFTADDVVWNFARITDEKAPQFYTQQMALTRAYTTNFASVEKIDDTRSRSTPRWWNCCSPIR